MFFVLQEKLSDRVEKQQQAQALQRYFNQADQLDQWLQSTRGDLTSCSHESNDEQLQCYQVRSSPTDHQDVIYSINNNKSTMQNMP